MQCIKCSNVGRCTHINLWLIKVASFGRYNSWTHWSHSVYKQNSPESSSQSSHNCIELGGFLTHWWRVSPECPHAMWSRMKLLVKNFKAWRTTSRLHLSSCFKIRVCQSLSISVFESNMSKGFSRGSRERKSSDHGPRQPKNTAAGTVHAGSWRRAIWKKTFSCNYLC